MRLKLLPDVCLGPKKTGIQGINAQGALNQAAW